MGWLRGMFGRRQRRRELEEEIEAHIAERVEALVASGVVRDVAERQARVEFGNRHTMLERSVVEWQLPWVESLWADLKLAFRRLRRSPGYAVTAVLTLAIGIGANAAIFTVIDDAMLRSLPVEDPGRLVALGYRSPVASRFMGVEFWPVFEQMRRSLHSVSGLSGWSGSMVTFPDEQSAQRSVGADLVTGNAFTTLGVRPVVGRLLMPADDVPGGPAGGWPVVLDYGFWVSNFRGDPSVVGRHLLVSGQPAVVVGVLPPDFFGLFVGQPQKLYLPLHFISAIAPSPAQDPFRNLSSFAVQAIARLQPGTTLSQLNAQLSTMDTPQMRRLLPARVQQEPIWRNVSMGAESVSRGYSAIRREYTEPLLLLQGIALAVLLLCCVNLAGLETARLEARRKDLALCAALGAGRRRLVQQSLVECFLLALAGGVFAAAIAWFGLDAMVAFLTPPGWGQPLALRPDAHLLWIAGGLAVLTTLAFGAVPATLTARVSPYGLMKGTGPAAGGARSRRFRVFIPVQFALALALVFLAGLFTHTLTALRGAPLGFNPDHVTGVTAQFQALKVPPKQLLLLYREMLDALRASPGMESASYTWYTPLTGDAPRITVHTLAHTGQDHSLMWNDVGDGYFATMDMHMDGRGFMPEDKDRSVCVVNEAAARLLFPGTRALGDSLEASKPENIEPRFTAVCRVVGVVDDARYASIREPAPPTVYFPIGESTLGGGGYANNMVFLMRSHTEADAEGAYREALRRYAPTTSYMVFFTLDEELDQSLGSERLIAGLSSVFAAAALLLSGIGLFGMLALRVTQRRAEIGVRLAVGATRGQILTLMLREALRLTAVGAVGGAALIGASVLFTRHFLFDTSPVQPSVLAGSVLLLGVVALAAALVPARRAASLDPVRVLRSE